VHPEAGSQAKQTNNITLVLDSLVIWHTTTKLNRSVTHQ